MLGPSSVIDSFQLLAHPDKSLLILSHLSFTLIVLSLKGNCALLVDRDDLGKFLFELISRGLFFVNLLLQAFVLLVLVFQG